MSNSSLVTYTNITSNKTTMNTKINDTITIHCFVGQVTAKQGCDYFANPKAQSSANYVVGKDGSIGLSVDEKDRAWTTGGSYTVNGETGAMNDHHAVTIEVACDKTAPYAITDKAYNALVKLVADIAKRNNIGELKWKADKTLVGQPDKQNMTVHRWFAPKACPGDYIYERLGNIAKEANAINAAGGQPIEKPAAANFDIVVTEKSGINCRKKPSVQTGSIIKVYPYNTRLHISKEQNNWGYTGEGWISLAYVKRVESINEMELAMKWVKEEGLMVGDETGNLMPKENLTREQFATILKRFADKFCK